MGLVWTAAGSEAPRRLLHQLRFLYVWNFLDHPKAVSPLGFATALQEHLASSQLFRD
jgi:hypothetical protein